MKTIKDFITEGFVLKQSSVDRLARDFADYASSKGLKKYLGVIGFKNTARHAELYFPSGDEKFIRNELGRTLRAGEIVVRYITAVSKSAGYVPLAKININKGLIYYNKPEASDEGILDFELRGEKLQYINLRSDYTEFLKQWMRGPL